MAEKEVAALSEQLRASNKQYTDLLEILWPHDSGAWIPISGEMVLVEARKLQAELTRSRAALQLAQDEIEMLTVQRDDFQRMTGLADCVPTLRELGAAVHAYLDAAEQGDDRDHIVATKAAMQSLATCATECTDSHESLIVEDESLPTAERAAAWLRKHHETCPIDPKGEDTCLLAAINDPEHAYEEDVKHAVACLAEFADIVAADWASEANIWQERAEYMEKSRAEKAEAALLEVERQRDDYKQLLYASMDCRKKVERELAEFRALDIMQTVEATKARAEAAEQKLAEQRKRIDDFVGHLPDSVIGRSFAEYAAQKLYEIPAAPLVEREG
jgi:hypothetical protein